MGFPYRIQTSGTRQEQMMFLIICINTCFKAGLQYINRSSGHVLYYKVDIIFQSNYLEEPIFIFTPGKSIAMTSVHASNFKIYSVSQAGSFCLTRVLYSDWFIVSSRFLSFCEFSEFSQASWGLVFLTYGLSARIFKEIWKVNFFSYHK